MPWSGTGIMFGFEFISYVMKIISVGGSLPVAILIRVAALGMHFSTTYIQKLIIDKGEDKVDNTKYLFAGWMCGVAIHMTWNTFGTIYNKELSKLIF